MGLLDGLLGGSGQQSSGMSPLTALLLGVLAYRTYQGKGRLADMLGRSDSAQPNQLAGNVAPNTGGGLGDLFRGGLGSGGLGGLLAGGAAGGLLGGGLNELLGRFQQNGHGDIANSWIGTGANRAISPDQLQQALGPDTVSSLAQQAGLSDIDVLSGLSRDLPDAVDQFTPNGEIPS
jgi:uncharacterized protein YidB (DUF937 family)